MGSDGMPPLLQTFYTQRWLLVESKGLGLLYWGALTAMVVWTFLQLLLSHGYTERHTPVIDVNFWQDKATDGNWWHRGDGSTPEYCGHRYYWMNHTSWGSDAVGCLDPSESNTTLFYQSEGTLRFATSIAYGTEYTSNNVHLYQDVEHSTVVLQVSMWTAKETREVKNCVVVDHKGKKIPSRVLSLYPTRNASSSVWQEREEYLMLSLGDMLRAAGRSWEDVGGEDAILRLQGVELVAHIDVRNFHRPFDTTGAVDCRVEFRVLRDQFTQVNRFYGSDTSVKAVQHGLKLKVVSTGSIGYPSIRAFLETVAVGLGGLALAQTIADFVAQFLHPKKREINAACIDTLRLELELAARMQPSPAKKAMGKAD